MTSRFSGLYRRLCPVDVFPHRWAFTLLFPLRSLFLSPKRLMERMEIQDDSTVLEVGSGPGFYSVPIAKKLTQGKLVLADIQPEMLEYAKKRLTKRGLTNVDFHPCDGNSFELPDDHFDAVFLVTVIGEVSHKREYMVEFFRMLKPGGILSISEQINDPHIMSIREVRELATEAGFIEDKIFGKPWNYTANFRKIATENSNPIAE